MPLVEVPAYGDGIEMGVSDLAGRAILYAERKMFGITVSDAWVPIDFCPKCGRDLRGVER